jgi:hypothetical protein
LPPELQKWLAKIRRPEYVGAEGRLIGRPVVSAVFKGSRFVAVGKQMMKFPPDATFHEFLPAFLQGVLGEPWIGAEQAKGSDAHTIVRWLQELQALRAGGPATGSAVRDVALTGNALALLTLAYDVYGTYHCAILPARILNRLKDPFEFQGAKYEIAVAGLYVRAGFTIEWINDSRRKRPEFIARHKSTGEALVVEAKSRHRPGVLRRPGAERVEQASADLDGLLAAALQKETDGLPYAIYLDANLPLAGPDDGLERMTDIQRMLQDRVVSGAVGPDPFAGITVTNFSWHYAGASSVGAQSESILVLPRHPAVPLRDARTLALILEATRQYGDVPAFFPDDS